MLASNVRNLIALTLVLAALPSGFSRADDPARAPEDRYNEVFDPSGNVREQYRVILPAWAGRVQHMSDYERQTFLEFKRGSQDSNAINDIPRMIPKAEYATVVDGVRQRERAIQAFLQDHYSGRKRYAKEGIISEDTVNQIIVRNGEWGYQGLINENTPLNFLYGPDLIRGPDGQFRALEDNLGFVGGFGDIVLAQQMSERLYPEIPKNYDYPKAIEFFHGLMDEYARQARNYGGKVVFYSDPLITDDSEDIRTVELFKQLGYESVSPYTKRRLDFREDGVYIQDRDGKNAEKVGFVVLNIEHADADLTNPATLEKAVLDSAAALIADKTARMPKEKRAELIRLVTGMDSNPEGRGLRLTQIKDMMANSGYRVNLHEQSKRAWGLVDAILKGRVGTSYTPGAEFVGDKQMYLHIEDFIRFYLGEEPIIRNVETYMFNQKGTTNVNEDVLDRVFGKDRKGADIGNWVIKPVDGRGGDGIIFGRELKASDIPALIERIRETPYRLQAQRNTPPSLMPANRITDTRPLTYSTRRAPITSPVPWSRSASLDKSRLINVSSGGAVNSVFVVAPKAVRTCAEMFVAVRH